MTKTRSGKASLSTGTHVGDKNAERDSEAISTEKRDAPGIETQKGSLHERTRQKEMQKQKGAKLTSLAERMSAMEAGL